MYLIIILHLLSKTFVMSCSQSVAKSLFTEPVPLRILAETGTVVAFHERKAVSATVGVNVQTLTNTKISLRCPVEGKPEPAISWSKAGQPLGSGERIQVDGNGTLTVQRTRVSDSGQYQCIARNALAEVFEISAVFVMRT